MSKSKRARRPKRIWMYGRIRVPKDMSQVDQLDAVLAMPGAMLLLNLGDDVVMVDDVEVPVAVWGFRRHMTHAEHAKKVREQEANRVRVKEMQKILDAEKEGEDEQVKED